VLQPAALPVVTPAPPPHGYRYDMASEIFGLLNHVRTQNGLTAVSAHGILTATADYYTKLHFTTADPYQLNHYLDGGPGSRAWNRGYAGGAVGEILVTSQGSAQGMVDLWMNSPSHHAVIMDPQYTDVGVSCYGGEYRSADGSIGYPVLCGAVFGVGG
jgi:uncharacterized protein YkwD